MRLFIALLLPALAACATQAPAPVNRDFSPPPSPEIARALELRDRNNLPKHVGGTAIYVDSVAVHHLYEEASTIAWRDEAGKWQWSQASEIGPGGLLDVERRLDPPESRTLSQAEARSLERLIRDPKLYSGEVRRTGQVGIGAPFHTMAIVTPFGRTIVKWDGRLRGPAGKVADIVLGHR